MAGCENVSALLNQQSKSNSFPTLMFDTLKICIQMKGVEIYFMEFYGTQNDKWTLRVSTLMKLQLILKRERNTLVCYTRTNSVDKM
ncbi:CLUMA_CG008872, isoform A [Clunio marinus]|uniref:CLUMA_CG008872, isoform A n=1 Tax=Clunio marinus TaxID=568069 RepID=A0A1J1I4H7_9DIPT|nr:CLUMA_CG008872, isoform A [Clunio marinus]